MAKTITKNFHTDGICPSMIKMRPTFIIIGSAKCGTTALASILESHPDCCMSRPKEVSFFQDTMDYKPNPNFEKGWEWYQKAFSHYAGEPVVGEATPSYSDRSRSPLTAQRIAEFNPEMKIIYMVREPVQRQVSAWKMQWTFGKEGSAPWRREDQWALQGFEYWMRKQREVGQWNISRYAYQLAAYQERFRAHQLFVSFLDDWKLNREAEVRRIMDFLGLDVNRWNSQSRVVANQGEDRTILKPWVSQISQSLIFRRIKNAFPAKMRHLVLTTYGRETPTPPYVDLESDILQEFSRYCRKDWEESPIFCEKGRLFWS